MSLFQTMLVMFQLDVLHFSGAWWQFLLAAVLISGVIGYVAGLRKGNSQIATLEVSLDQVMVNLRDCQTDMLKLTKPGEKSLDDFKVIEGIGPRIEKLLHQNGIRTYSQLSLAAPNRIKELLAASSRYPKMRNLETWPHQALLATSGQWNRLKELQAQLDADKG